MCSSKFHTRSGFLSVFQLRGFQQRSLTTLEAYLRGVREHGAQKAFVLATARPYRAPLQLPGLPYICLRVPTGGGKTFMACHAAGIAAKSYLQREQAVCLWLVPSNVIREQTLQALRDRSHPYRQALDTHFAGRVQVMDLAEALYVQRSTLESETAIIVSTIAAFRVEDTEGRKVYEESGALQHHFARIPEGLGSVLERRESGSYICSLANVLRMWRPIIIVDEAHNARTPLSFDTLARFNPACIIEFTATPETQHAPEQELFASNILHHVSARELKAEDMVKLPIKLRTQGDWKEVIAAALQARRTLQEAAEAEQKETGEYIRPVILFQAQPRNQERQTLTAEVVKQCLIEDFKIPAEEIAIATGQTREIDDLDLFDPHCPIKYIITVYALKEGWDCSFAYVLCSVADIGTPRAVEQILGRILRLPRATRKKREELDCAYAFVASPRFIEAATTLKDALVENGFQQLDAETLVTAQEQQELSFDPGPLFTETSVQVSQPPDLSKLDPLIRRHVSFDASTSMLTYAGPLTGAGVTILRNCFSNPSDREAVERLYAGGGVSPKRDPVKVPALAIRVDGQLEFFEETHFLDTEWDLSKCDAGLSELEFSSTVSAGAAGVVDVDEAGQIRFVQDMQEQFALLLAEPGWTVAGLVNWLDRQIPHPDIPQAQSSGFIHRVVTALIETRGLTIEQLARQKFRLREVIAQKIDGHRQVQAKKEYQQLLFGRNGTSIEVSPKLCFELSEDRYAPNWYYEGGYRFQKHYYRAVGELKSEGEEYECAVFLDALPQIKYWIRNIDQRPESSFWLPTSTDKFYPDFVCLLADGRFLVVEYKGEDRWSNDDSKEKRAVGELWADRSNGRCLFVMPKGRDFGAIQSLVEGRLSRTAV